MYFDVRERELPKPQLSVFEAQGVVNRTPPCVLLSPHKSHAIQNVIWPSSLYVWSLEYAHWEDYLPIGTVSKISRVEIKVCKCTCAILRDDRLLSREKCNLLIPSTQSTYK